MQVEDDRFVMVKRSYIEICDDNYCAAAMLALFEFLTNGRITAGLESPHWIRRSHKEISEELFGLYGRNKIMASVDLLTKREFLSKTSGSEAPGGAYLYQLQIGNLNYALKAYQTPDALSQKGHPPVLNGTPPCPKRDNAPYYKKEEEVKKGTSADADESAPPEPGFEEFWRDSPRRGSKVKAREQWKKFAKGGPEVRAEMFRGLHRAMLSHDWLDCVVRPKSGDAPGQFIPHLERFLKKELWRDSVSWTPYLDHDTTFAEVGEIWNTFRPGRNAKQEPEPEPKFELSPEDQKLVDQATGDVSDTEAALGKFGLSLPGVQAQNWITPLKPKGFVDGVLVILAPGQAHVAWISVEYLDALRRKLGWKIRLVAPKEVT